MNKFIENLNWRYAAKKFDTSKQVSREDLEQIIEVFTLSPSSFWLQPWKLFVVENKDLKEKIKEKAFNQEQVWENSYLLVFARLADVTEDLVEKFLDKTAEVRGVSREDLSGYEEVLKGFINNTSKENLDVWAWEQVFLALWNVLNFLADKKIDSCPVWGFDRDSIDEILNLKEKWYKSLALLPIWYRDESDKYSSIDKVRFDKEEVSEII